jgi:hypothetical protein
MAGKSQENASDDERSAIGLRDFRSRPLTAYRRKKVRSTAKRAIDRGGRLEVYVRQAAG